MARTNHKAMSLYQDAKAGLSSLVKQMTVVSIGFLALLLVTGGRPPAWLVGIGFFSSTLFVAWSEQERITQSRKNSLRHPESSLEESHQNLSTSQSPRVSIHGLRDDVGIVTRGIEPQQPGRVKYRATWWNAVCPIDVKLPAGTEVRIIGTVHITLIVEPLLQSKLDKTTDLDTLDQLKRIVKQSE